MARGQKGNNAENQMLIKGKGKYDKKSHFLYSRNYSGSETYMRICNLRLIDGELIISNSVDCENCLIRQYDDQWLEEEHRGYGTRHNPRATLAAMVK